MLYYVEYILILRHMECTKLQWRPFASALCVMLHGWYWLAQ